MLEEIAVLGDLSRHELADRWTTIYRTSPPKGARRVLLERAIAWHLQAGIEGGLRKDVLRRLERVEPSRNAPSTVVTENGRGGASSSSARQRESLRPGTRLVREWHGRTHIVEVIAAGFVWNGETYGSLSEIARLITGARWSGPRFFGT
ncbi:MAG: DUF2924 domain-containing protein [Oricola sp.]